MKKVTLVQNSFFIFVCLISIFAYGCQNNHPNKEISKNYNQIKSKKVTLPEGKWFNDGKWSYKISKISYSKLLKNYWGYQKNAKTENIFYVIDLKIKITLQNLKPMIHIC